MEELRNVQDAHTRLLEACAGGSIDAINAAAEEVHKNVAVAMTFGPPPEVQWAFVLDAQEQSRARRKEANLRFRLALLNWNQ